MDDSRADNQSGLLILAGVMMAVSITSLFASSHFYSKAFSFYRVDPTYQTKEQATQKENGAAAIGSAAIAWGLAIAFGWPVANNAKTRYAAVAACGGAIIALPFSQYTPVLGVTPGGEPWGSGRMALVAGHVLFLALLGAVFGFVAATKRASG